jgi:streptomycin 6-kinase
MVIVSARLAAACRGTLERRAWLERLPDAIDEVRERWSLELGVPFDDGDGCLAAGAAAATAAWVAPAARSDGTRAVLKLAMPHMEGAHELDALRYWDGDPTVRLLEADAELDAMLLERCDPGTNLRTLPEPEQDVVIAGLLHRLWRQPPSHGFRPLSTMTAHWIAETTAAAAEWRVDRRLIDEGLRLLRELAGSSTDAVLLATDLHAGNVLRAQREEWLVIDPKPFVGDRAYDATQHLLNCQERLLAAPAATIQRFADLLEVDAERVRLWLFARAAAEPRDRWDEESMVLARALANLGI